MVCVIGPRAALPQVCHSAVGVFDRARRRAREFVRRRTGHRSHPRPGRGTIGPEIPTLARRPVRGRDHQSRCVGSDDWHDSGENRRIVARGSWVGLTAAPKAQPPEDRGERLRVRSVRDRQPHSPVARGFRCTAAGAGRAVGAAHQDRKDIGCFLGRHWRLRNPASGGVVREGGA
jgi:hypothetical protein